MYNLEFAIASDQYFCTTKSIFFLGYLTNINNKKTTHNMKCNLHIIIQGTKNWLHIKMWKQRKWLWKSVVQGQLKLQFLCTNKFIIISKRRHFPWGCLTLKKIRPLWKNIISSAYTLWLLSWEPRLDWINRLTLDVSFHMFISSNEGYTF